MNAYLVKTGIETTTDTAIDLVTGRPVNPETVFQNLAMNLIGNGVPLLPLGDNKPTVNAPYKPEIETTRVGRWMSQAEYDKMVSTGKVQMSANDMTHVSRPADIDAFKAATKGSVYVEFDVPTSSIKKGGHEKWGIIHGLDSTRGKYYGVTEVPDATNIEIKGRN